MKDVLRSRINEKLQGDISQDALAEAIGISQATIHKILYTETKHTFDVLQRCADYFQVPISQFYDGESGATGQRTDTALRDIAAARDQQRAEEKGGDYTEILKRYIIRLETENEKLKDEILYLTTADHDRRKSAGT